MSQKDCDQQEIPEYILEMRKLVEALREKILKETILKEKILKAKNPEQSFMIC